MKFAARAILKIKRNLKERFSADWVPDSTRVLQAETLYQRRADGASVTCKVECWMLAYKYYSDMWMINMSRSYVGGSAGHGRVSFQDPPKAFPLFAFLAQLHQEALALSAGPDIAAAVAVSLQAELLTVCWDQGSTRDASVIEGSMLLEEADVAAASKRGRAPQSSNPELPNDPQAEDAQARCLRGGNQRCTNQSNALLWVPLWGAAAATSPGLRALSLHLPCCAREPGMPTPNTTRRFVCF